MLKDAIGEVIINVYILNSCDSRTCLRAPYTLDKAALMALTKHIEIEYGRYNIQACTLALGNIAIERQH
jgi:NAD(P)-dependent dehydrogenase (short-subunit alcohol dehydrogenase family)